MSAVFETNDRQLENTPSMSDVADVFRTHWNVHQTFEPTPMGTGVNSPTRSLHGPAKNCSR